MNSFIENHIKMKKLYFFALAALVFNISCQSTSNNMDHSEDADGNSISEVLVVDDFITKVEATEAVQLIDVRTTQEVAQGSIEGATNINFYDEDFKDQIAKLDREKAVFVYCKSGGRSAKTAEICKSLGFKKVYDLKGGYSAYSAQ